MREVVADYVGEYLFENEADIMRLARDNKTVFSRVWQWIKDAVARMRRSADNVYLLKAEKLYQKAFDAANKKSTSASDGEVKNSYIGTNKDNIREYKSGFDDDVPMNERKEYFKKQVSTVFNFGAIEKKRQLRLTPRTKV